MHRCVGAGRDRAHGHRSPCAIDTGGQLAAVVVYGVCVTAMLAVSGTYHARRLLHRERRLLRRLDHTMILVGIAGTYTAVIVLALDGADAGRAARRGVGASSSSAAAIRMLWLDAPSGLIALVYLVAGWQLLLDLPAYTAALDAAELTMLAVGGGLYSVGAVVYALKRPNPWPAVFGFHEVFHTFVVLGAAVPLGRRAAADAPLMLFRGRDARRHRRRRGDGGLPALDAADGASRAARCHARRRAGHRRRSRSSSPTTITRRRRPPAGDASPDDVLAMLSPASQATSTGWRSTSPAPIRGSRCASARPERRRRSAVLTPAARPARRPAERAVDRARAAR